MYTLEKCEQLWSETGKHGTPAERIERTKKWLPYYSYLAEKQLGSEYKPSEQINSFLSHLAAQDLLRNTDSVIDIGAGMGSYALDFARICGKVTALEPNGDCLKVLTNRAEQCGFDNIETIISTWEEFQPTEKYDVSFSAMCPAICNTDELRRMESITRRTCCLVSVMRGSYDRHRKAMMSELGVRPSGGMTTEVLHYYNALYLMGRQPNVVCKTIESSSKIPAEQILEQYPIYFRIFGVDEDVSVPFLKEYLSRNAVNGVLEEESRLNLAMVYWNV